MKKEKYKFNKLIMILVTYFIGILLTLCIAGNLTFAQVTEEWVAFYNGPGNGTDVGFAVAVDESGNSYVTGRSTGLGPPWDYATIKYDTNGNQLWAAQYNGPGDNDDSAFDIAVDGSGNVYVTGYSFGSGTGYDYATIKYDASGNQLWVARYNGPGNGSDIAQNLAIDNMGNVYVTGSSFGSAGTDNDYATIKYDTNGNQLWVARYNGPESFIDFPYALAVDNFGNVYVTGLSQVVATGVSSAADTIKYDTNGNQQWVARYNDPSTGSHNGRNLVVDTVGNVYITGESGIGRGPDTADLLTIKYDTDGNQIWLALYNGLGNDRDVGTAIGVDSTGNVYVTGLSTNPSTGIDSVTIKYDANGTQVWENQYFRTGNGDDITIALITDTEDNIYVTGWSFVSSTGFDQTTIKYDTDGNQIWLALYNGSGNGTDSGQALALDLAGNVYVTGDSFNSTTGLDYLTIKYNQQPGSVDLSINKSDSPDPVLIGQTLTYTVTVTNNGPDNATGVTLTDTLPGSVSFVSANATQGSCSETSGTVTCDIGSLSNGSNSIVTIEVTPTASGGINNTASVVGNETDPVPGNNSDSETTTVNPGSATDLSITKVDSPEPVEVGNNLTYTLTVTNNGPGGATGVTVTDTLPSNVTWVSSTPSQGSCSGSTTVTCNLGSLPNGAFATVDIVVTPTTTGYKTNTASVTANESDTDLVNNSDTAVTFVYSGGPLPPPQADLSVIKLDSPDPVNVGEDLTYTIIATNHGPYSATVTVTDPLPAGVNYVSANPSQGSCSGTSLVSCNVGTLGNEESATVTIVVTPISPGTLSNTVNVSGSVPDLNADNNYATAQTSVSGTSSKLGNISTRAFVGTGANVEIGGFIIEGTEPKTVLIRGRGPSMSGQPFNISGTLSNPFVRVYSFASGMYIAQNDDWQTSDPLCGTSGYVCGGEAEIIATGLDPCQPNPGQSSAPPGCANESAVLITLPPGQYGAIMNGVNDGTGVGLVEVFDVDSGLSILENISTRAFVGTGANVGIGGFIIEGTISKTVLIRGRGPSMSGQPFNISGTLSNPFVRVYSFASGTYIAQNDDWQTSDPLCATSGFVCGGEAEIIATGLDPCQPNPDQSTAPPGCTNESAVLMTLPPGQYGAIVSGVSNGTGVGLVEVFEVP